METLFFRVAVVSAAVSLVLLPLLLAPGWRRRYAPHTRRAVWLGIALVLLAAPLLPKAQAPVQLTVPASATIPAGTPLAFRHVIVPAQPSYQETEEVEGASPETRAFPTAAWGTILAVLWLTGGAAVLLWQGTAYGLARRRLMRRAVPLAGHEELAAELCPRRSVRFFRVDGLDTPMTLGTFRPVVLLPGGEVCQAALRHELFHIRRWDVGWKALMLLSCAVHWFNPLVWLMSRRADRDMEASCDAAAVADGDAAERRSYGELLLRTAAGRRIPFTTQFGGGKRLMKERLYDLFHPGKKSRLLVGVILLLCLLAGSLVACRSGADTVPDGIYCAPMPGFVEVDGQTDFEQWEFTLMEYDPESGETGAVLGAVVLPLAEELTLQRLGADAPVSAGRVGTQGRNRSVTSFLWWPMLRSSIPPNQSDLLEVQVKDGEVTFLKWFQVPAEESIIIEDDGEEIAATEDAAAESQGGQSGGAGSSLASFSYAADAAEYLPGDPGVNPNPFVNTDAAPITDQASAVERAKNECTIEYNTISKYYDEETDMWRVDFLTRTKNDDGIPIIAPGSSQSVYLDSDGITQLIVYGE